MTAGSTKLIDKTTNVLLVAGSPEAELTMLAELAGVEPKEDADRMPTALSSAAIRSARASVGGSQSAVESPSASEVGGAGGRSGGEAVIRQVEQMLIFVI